MLYVWRIQDQSKYISSKLPLDFSPLVCTPARSYLKAGSQYDAGPRAVMRQHTLQSICRAPRHDAQIENRSIHASRCGASRFIVCAMFTIAYCVAT